MTQVGSAEPVRALHRDKVFPWNNSDAELGVYSAVLILVSSGLAFILQNFGLERGGISGLTVPDAVSLTRTVKQAWSNGWSSLPNISTLAGVVLIYSPIVVCSQVAAAGINAILLWGSTFLFARSVCVARPDAGARSIALFALLGVVSNIYILEVIGWANKEIPLIFLTTVIYYFVIAKKSILIALAVTPFVYFIRDGYALILVICLMAVAVRVYVGLNAAIVFIGALATFGSLVPSEDLSAFSGEIERNVAIGSEVFGGRFEMFGFFAYAVKLFGNVINLGWRPQFLTNSEDINLLNVGYWQLGVVMIAGFTWAIRNIAESNKLMSAASLLIIVSLLGISYGTFVQPRYMMPMILWLNFAFLDSRCAAWLALATCVSLPFVFLAFDALPPLAG